jgi:anti-sigma B factor antagonist
MSLPHSRPNCFELDVERRDDATIVRVRGEFDLAAERPCVEFFRQLEDGQKGELILDLREVTFLDSTGLRLILDLWNRSREEGFDLAVLPGTGSVQRLFELTGLDRVLPIITGVPATDSQP